MTSFQKIEIGTIITGTILVDSPPGFEPMCRIDKDAYIDEYKKLTDLVHKNGANIIAQLHTIRELDIPVDEIHRVADLQQNKFDVSLFINYIQNI